MPVIVSTTAGFPEHYYSQGMLLAEAQREWGKIRPSIVKPLEQFYTNVRVNGRYLSWRLERYKERTTFEERNNAYIETALALGERTICDLLDQVQMGPQEIDQLTAVSTTGISVPSLDARLMNHIPFSRGMKRLPLFGPGCMGGAAGIARTADYLQGHPDEAVILFAVELCSLTIQRDDLYRHYRTFYTPSNAVLAVAGDFQTETMLARIRELFEPVPDRGWKYIDKAATSAGVFKVKLLAGAEGEPKLSVLGKGTGIQLPAPYSFERMLAPDQKVGAALVTSSGECWAAEFESAAISKNTVKMFKGTQFC